MPNRLLVYHLGYWSGVREGRGVHLVGHQLLGKFFGIVFARTENPELAHVVTVSVFCTATAADRALQLARTRGQLGIWLTLENTLRFPQHNHYHLSAAGLVIGLRKDIAVPNYVRLLWWVIQFAQFPQNGSCKPTLPKALMDNEPRPEEWAARKGGHVILIARHAAYPRSDLFKAINASRILSPVAAPSKAFNNMQWPGKVSKHALVRQYRFIIAPENSVEGGYVSEKVKDALLAGAVPIYWGGEHPPAPDIFNPKRILVFNGTNMAEIVSRMESLVLDAEARKAFFAEHVLMPSAEEAVQTMCTTFVERFASAWDAARGPACDQQLLL